MTRRRSARWAALIVAAFTAVGCATDYSGADEGDPWLNAGTSESSSQVALHMLPEITSRLLYDLTTGNIRANPGRLDEVTEWMKAPGGTPTSPPYWQVLRTTILAEHGEYQVVSYYLSRDDGPLTSPPTWGHACGTVTVTPMANSVNTTATSTPADCPAGLPDKFSSNDLPTSAPETP